MVHNQLVAILFITSIHEQAFQRGSDKSIEKIALTIYEVNLHLHASLPLTARRLTELLNILG
ncbi:MAG: hypothetical protein WDW20_02245 [Neisseriaceae bacterium]